MNRIFKLEKDKNLTIKEEISVNLPKIGQKKLDHQVRKKYIIKIKTKILVNLYNK